jgi:hypothetical protein
VALGHGGARGESWRLSEEKVRRRRSRHGGARRVGESRLGLKAAAYGGLDEKRVENEEVI